MVANPPSANVVRPPQFQGPSSGGTGARPPSGRTTMRDYVDARDDAVESRLSAKLDRLPTKGTIWGAVAAIVGSILTSLAIIISVLAFSGSRFDAGMSVSPTMQTAQSEQAKVDARQDAQMKAFDKKLDVIIKQTAKP